MADKNDLGRRKCGKGAVAELDSSRNDYGLDHFKDVWLRETYKYEREKTGIGMYSRS